MGDRDEDVISLTHTCRAWREVFISRSSLWTDFDCEGLNVDKARVYLERSKSSLIHLRLVEGGDLSPHHPFLQIIPHAIGRLKSLCIDAIPENLEDITTHLSRPAPTLEYLSIYVESEPEQRNPTLTTALFNGDLASLRDLVLQSVRTELPWRNMVNLTTFMLYHTSPREVTIKQFLDFFGSAPHLCKIELISATPTSGAQNGRLVSLACLKRMNIIGDEPPSLFLDHLVIPAGAELKTQATLQSSLIEDHLPQSLNNLRNLPDFTDIYLCVHESYT
jgi:hypothetical protein